jgi:biopolymer transport protein ExbD
MRFKSGSSDASELINISSMIDVMFILVIFFLVTTTFKEQEVDELVNLPTDKRNQSMSQSKGNLMIINIRQNGEYYVMGAQMTEEQLAKWVKDEVTRKPELKVILRADEDSKHLFLANVISICRFAGIKEANIAIRPKQ